MKKTILSLLVTALTVLSLPLSVRAEGGIYASGGGTKTAGETFTVNVTASGATFDSLQGLISVSGPVDIVSFSAGGATWLPGKTPSNGGQFVGIVSERNSLTVATIKLRGKYAGSGSVSVSGARLAHKGTVVGSGAGGSSFTINRAPDLPNGISVSSSTHPNQEENYTEKNITLSWEKEGGVIGFSYLLDQVADTTPPAKVTSANTTITYENKEIGTWYFHIRAQNGDGWGSTTHFKINIKEPDPKVDETLPKPTGILITKDSAFVNDIVAGTLAGIKLSGSTLPSYLVNINITPLPTFPEGYIDSLAEQAVALNTKPLSAHYTISGDQGSFEKIFDIPFRAGFYKLTVQGQLDKVLTPLSDEIRFEVSLKDGGSVKIIEDADAYEPAPIPPATTWDKAKELLLDRNFEIGSGIFIILLIGGIGGWVWWRKRRETIN